ncbi:hypothetical protein FQN60_018411 [Etheostoma spectabile]|uniref:Uncharacterized protein n=1 Tax=Etheostoma spectabile TaxID=54343 RepID=A0A5J5DHW3_9PERO|nr:hypothetical protein FQN60_018411 [Etheostoma spectabile]
MEERLNHQTHLKARLLRMSKKLSAPLTSYEAYVVERIHGCHSYTADKENPKPVGERGRLQRALPIIIWFFSRCFVRGFPLHKERPKANVKAEVLMTAHVLWPCLLCSAFSTSNPSHRWLSMASTCSGKGRKMSILYRATRSLALAMCHAMLALFLHPAATSCFYFKRPAVCPPGAHHGCHCSPGSCSTALWDTGHPERTTLMNLSAPCPVAPIRSILLGNKVLGSWILFSSAIGERSRAWTAPSVGPVFISGAALQHWGPAVLEQLRDATAGLAGCRELLSGNGSRCKHTLGRTYGMGLSTNLQAWVMPGAPLACFSKRPTHRCPRAEPSEGEGEREMERGEGLLRERHALIMFPLNSSQTFQDAD